jgi:hypothetical protein
VTTPTRSEQLDTLVAHRVRQSGSVHVGEVATALVAPEKQVVQLAIKNQSIRVLVPDGYIAKKMTMGTILLEWRGDR